MIDELSLANIQLIEKTLKHHKQVLRGLTEVQEINKANFFEISYTLGDLEATFRSQYYFLYTFLEEDLSNLRGIFFSYFMSKKIKDLEKFSYAFNNFSIKVASFANYKPI